MEEEEFPVLYVLPDGLPALRNSPLFIRAIAFLLVFAQFVLAQQPTPIRSRSEADAGRRIRSYGAGYLYTRIQQKGA